MKAYALGLRSVAMLLLIGIGHLDAQMDSLSFDHKRWSLGKAWAAGQARAQNAPFGDLWMPGLADFGIGEEGKRYFSARDILPETVISNPSGNSFLCRLETRIEKRWSVPLWVKADEPLSIPSGGMPASQGLFVQLKLFLQEE